MIKRIRSPKSHWHNWKVCGICFDLCVFNCSIVKGTCFFPFKKNWTKDAYVHIVFLTWVNKKKIGDKIHRPPWFSGKLKSRREREDTVILNVTICCCFLNIQIWQTKPDRFFLPFVSIWLCRNIFLDERLWRWTWLSTKAVRWLLAPPVLQLKCLLVRHWDPSDSWWLRWCPVSAWIWNAN